ncbi:Spiroplasmavirus-related protein [Spiroplasma kunkelii CR2-3x]|uniref:Spiroplasmavirus-related protein n=1 Tax=Spiroplasma kunkelii CR2-3x TaxID=273035 RepID=A0A0K2JGS3_SPIKU|nr:IS30 family transposase [Spiroplasma kunkelii]ALA97627.1 Spiroplasmavirus-related protein [Spiroplasma kunkelii CR2-3x]
MKDYTHVKYDERRFFKDLFLSDSCKKKNGTINLSEISRQTGRDINTVKREIKRFKKIEDYTAVEAHKDYHKKRKKCIKKLPEFTEEQLNFIQIRFNKYHDSPRELIYRYFLKFGVKFPACVKTFYKWVRLGEFGLKKENLRYRGKKYKTKGKKDNRGQLTNFKSIWNIENKLSNVGWFEMDTVVGKNHQSSCLVLVEQSSRKYFAIKLENHTAMEVLSKFKEMVINNNLMGKIKGIITDRGREFYKWREMEIFAETQVYFCDAGKPQQKPLIEYMNSELRHWFHKKTDFNKVSQKRLNWVVNNVINEKIRPCLNWISAKEIFLQNIK